jgi:opacity protein-like surface antigen
MGKIRTSLLATAAVLALSGSVFAADMGVPRKAPPPAPPPAPIWNWTGFYVGGNLGVGISREKWSAQPLFVGSALFFDSFTGSDLGKGLESFGSHNSVGVLGGFTAGYNWQFPGTPWLVGIEGEWMFSDLEGDHGTSRGFSSSFNFLCFEEEFVCTETANGNQESRVSTKIDDIATIAARVGITSGPEDRTLWYVKGGGAWVRDNFAVTTHANGQFCLFEFTFNACDSNTFDGSGSTRQNQWGWMVGTGVEWGLAYNLSAKIEYEFLDFGNHTFTIPVSGHFADGDSGAFNRNFNVDQQIHIVKVGLNYRFNWGAGGY